MGVEGGSGDACCDTTTYTECYLDLNNNGSKLLQTLTDDTMLINMHRRLHHKYGRVVLTYIIFNFRIISLKRN